MDPTQPIEEGFRSHSAEEVEALRDDLLRSGIKELKLDALAEVGATEMVEALMHTYSWGKVSRLSSVAGRVDLRCRAVSWA